LTREWRVIWTGIVLVAGVLLWRYPEEFSRDGTIPACLAALYAIWFWRRR